MILTFLDADTVVFCSDSHCFFDDSDIIECRCRCFYNNSGRDRCVYNDSRCCYNHSNINACRYTFLHNRSVIPECRYHRFFTVVLASLSADDIVVYCDPRCFLRSSAIPECRYCCFLQRFWHSWVQIPLSIQWCPLFSSCFWHSWMQIPMFFPVILALLSAGTVFSNNGSYSVLQWSWHSWMQIPCFRYGDSGFLECRYCCVYSDSNCFIMFLTSLTADICCFRTILAVSNADTLFLQLFWPSEVQIP